MIAKRILASVACVPLLTAVAVGQSTFTAPTPPKTVPAASSEPFGKQWPPPSSLFPGKGGGGNVRLASATEPGQPVQAQAVMPPPPTAVDTLTGAPISMDPMAAPVRGAVYSPWVGDNPAGACCGPVGANGPVTYEGYFRTGVSLLSGGGTMTAVTKTFGWNVQAGSRSLFFNPTGDAAWVLDLGIGFTGNAGRGASNPININTNSVKFGGGDGVFPVGVREVRRTSLNFGFGRDYFLNGPGAVGDEPGYGNFRAGWDIGGRWGTSSVGFEPFGDPDGYRRRQSIYHGVYTAGQGTWEVPMGGWTFYLGGRIEWGYYWANMIPPNEGDFRDVNLLLLTGVRF
jgi:hypothetical protein